MDLTTGDVVQGRIAEVRDFGAFVWLGSGQKGLIHISEISDEFVKDIREKVKPNQKVKIKILSIKEDGRIELSLKQAAGLDYTRPPRVEERDELPMPAPEVFASEPPQFDFNLEEELRKANYDFDQMLKVFKRMSEENLVDLKRNLEAKRAGGKKKRKKRALHGRP
jgi:S1 RNA binding domain protein